MNRTLVILGCLAVAMLVANVSATPSGSSSSASSTSSGGGGGGGVVSSGSSSSGPPAPPAPAIPSVPTNPTAPVRPNSPNVPFAPVQPAPSQVTDTRVITLPNGFTATLTFTITSIDNSDVTTTSFGPVGCTTTQCRAFRQAISDATGIPIDRIRIDSIANAGAKFQTTALATTVTLTGFTTAQDALIAIRKAESFAADGVLVSGTNRIATVITNSPAVPATPATPGSPTAPTSTGLAGAILDVQVVLGTTAAAFDSLSYRNGIAQLMNLPSNAYVTIINTPTDTIRANKFSTSQNALIVNTRIQDPTQTTAQGVYNKFVTALAITQPVNTIAGVTVLGTPTAQNIPTSAAWSRPSLLVGFVALLAALAAFL